MNIISYTSKGLRSKNEDYLLSEEISHDVSFHIIADGMGGYSYGDKAAKIVVDAILDAILLFDYDKISKQDIINACKNANCRIQKESVRLRSKLGATFAAVLVLKNKVFAFWMGDTRIYQYDKNRKVLFQSTDHSLIKELQLNKELEISEIEKYDSIVTRSLTGSSWEKPPQIEILQYSSEDAILLCSDGLYKQVEPNIIIKKSLNEQLSFFKSIENKMNDNYSIIVIG